MPDAHFALLDDRAVLAVSGPDCRSFLQGLVSNDVGKIGADRAGYAALLTAQGKYLHDFMMVELEGAVCLDAEAARLADLKRRLSVYRLRAKAALDGRLDLGVAAVFGEDALAMLGLPAEPGAARPFEGGVAFTDPRLVRLGARCLLPRERAKAALAAAGFEGTEAAAYDRLRLELGVPDGSRDLVVEKSILLESGFDELNGVDWGKGCYIGQELTARTKYRGLIRKRLIPVAMDGPAPAPGAIISAEGREAGEMRSSRDGRGLALLRVEAVLEKRPLAAGEARLVPSIPGWMRLDAATG